MSDRVTYRMWRGLVSLVLIGMVYQAALFAITTHQVLSEVREVRHALEEMQGRAVSDARPPLLAPVWWPRPQDSLLAVEASGRSAALAPGVSSARDERAWGSASDDVSDVVALADATAARESAATPAAGTGGTETSTSAPTSPETSQQEEGAAGTPNEPTPLPTALAVPSSRGEVAPILPPVSLADLLVEYEASEPERMLAVAWCESRYVPSAVNRRSGARGTWQFMAPTWAWVRESLPHIGPYDNAFDVALSTEAAVWLWETDGEHNWRECLP